jgi:hypothetical protein
MTRRPSLFPGLRPTFPRLVADLEAEARRVLAEPGAPAFVDEPYDAEQYEGALRRLPFERVAEGKCVELLGSGYYFAPFDKLSSLDAARLIHALK